ncbi:Retinol dehydrogenase 16 [Saguinus oedipus]|uniref:Retinol dehydrogenase 16 n=1 Tax=Saguinus oedipus TaxID=9490 RepID=A0ABQ9UYB0_SAGOE|nr:Retinol dehydrogenase 16 [Saguinus oedipus]
MCLYLAVLLGLYHLLRWYQERQVLSYLRYKSVFIMDCDTGFRSLLARQLKAQKGAEQLRGQISDRLETVTLDVTKTETVAAAVQWVKERVGHRAAVAQLGRQGDSWGRRRRERAEEIECGNSGDLLAVRGIGAASSERHLQNLKELSDQVIPEVKKTYGEKFLTAYE